MKREKLGAAALVLGLVSWSAAARAQIVVGPYEFTDEAWFADTASMVGEPEILPVSVTTVEEAVVGYTPMSGVMNVGFPCAAPEWVDVGFTDVLPFEGAGPDVVLFDARFSVDDFAVQVRAVGSADFEAVHIYPSTMQVPTGVEGPSASEIWAVEVDFADFGVPLGTEVDAVRIIGNCEVTPNAEPDVVMAAAVDRSCTIDADCDDGDPCTAETCPIGTCSYEASPIGTPCARGVCLGTWPTECVACVSDAQCTSAAAPQCDVSSNTCVACIAASDCADDGEACTLEACVDGACTATPAPAGAPCEGGVCLEDGVCVACFTHEHCDDGDACTVDACVQQVCEHAGVCPTSANPGGTGGAPPVGGGGAGGGGGETPPPDDDGCSCGVAGRGGLVPGFWVVLGLLIARRRRRSLKAQAWPRRGRRSPRW